MLPNDAAPQAPSLMPQADPQDPQDPHHDMLSSGLGMAKAQFKQLEQAREMTHAIRAGLDKLVEMGPSVSQDDVLEAMAGLVAKGADPKSFSALMAGNPSAGEPPMPQGGEALAGWLMAQDQKFQQMEQQVKVAHAVAGQRMGVAAMHTLVNAHAQGAGAKTAPAGPSPQPNVPSSPLLQ